MRRRESSIGRARADGSGRQTQEEALRRQASRQRSVLTKPPCNGYASQLHCAMHAVEERKPSAATVPRQPDRQWRRNLDSAVRQGTRAQRQVLRAQPLAFLYRRTMPIGQLHR